MANTTVVTGRSGIIKAEAKLVIKEFVEVMAGFKPGMLIESDPFMLGDTQLSIRVFSCPADSSIGDLVTH